MPKSFNYGRNARRFATRFPALSYVLAQVIFWEIAYAVLAILMYLILLTPGSALPALHGSMNLEANFFISLFFGLCFGITSGFSDLFFERRFFYNRALGITIISKTFISLLIFIILISIVRYVHYPYVMKKFFHEANPASFQPSWDAFFYLLLIYNIFIGLVINFINQVNKKYGPGVLLPLLMGKYRNPKEEERIFLFMDLRSSTAIAEALGHLKYSAFIRDSFMDINSVLSAHYAQVYQYVGDEIVLTWTIEEGLKNFSCIRFFFACETRFKNRATHYLNNYGHVPQFKAGLHMGKVTAVEVGDIKRDIAYHGDTLNTAARIQSACNHYNKKFLASMYVLETTGLQKYYEAELIGMVELKGKSNPVEIASINRLK